jgi:predicted DNA-binding protein
MPIRAYIVVMERFALFIPKELKARVARLAKKTGLGLSDLIRRAIEEYVSKHGC